MFMNTADNQRTEWVINVVGGEPSEHDGDGGAVGELLRAHADANLLTCMTAEDMQTGEPISTFLVAFGGDIVALKAEIAERVGGRVDVQGMDWD